VDGAPALTSIGPVNAANLFEEFRVSRETPLRQAVLPAWTEKPLRLIGPPGPSSKEPAPTAAAKAARSSSRHQRIKLKAIGHLDPEGRAESPAKGTPSNPDSLRRHRKPWVAQTRRCAGTGGATLERR